MSSVCPRRQIYATFERNFAPCPASSARIPENVVLPPSSICVNFSEAPSPATKSVPSVWTVPSPSRFTLISSREEFLSAKTVVLLPLNPSPAPEEYTRIAVAAAPSLTCIVWEETVLRVPSNVKFRTRGVSVLPFTSIYCGVTAEFSISCWISFPQPGSGAGSDVSGVPPSLIVIPSGILQAVPVIPVGLEILAVLPLFILSQFQVGTGIRFTSISALLS